MRAGYGAESAILELVFRYFLLVDEDLQNLFITVTLRKRRILMITIKIDNSYCLCEVLPGGYTAQQLLLTAAVSKMRKTNIPQNVLLMIQNRKGICCRIVVSTTDA